MIASLFTPWSENSHQVQPLTDSERHALYCNHVREVANHKFPFLFPLLDHCCASVLVRPGLFTICIGNPPQWHEVKELSQSLTFLPWAEELQPVMN